MATPDIHTEVLQFVATARPGVSEEDAVAALPHRQPCRVRDHVLQAARAGEIDAPVRRQLLLDGPIHSVGFIRGLLPAGWRRLRSVR